VPSRGRTARPARRRSPPACDRATDATVWWVGRPKAAFSAGGHRSSNEMNSGTSRVDANDPGEARAFATSSTASAKGSIRRLYRPLPSASVFEVWHFGASGRARMDR